MRHQRCIKQEHAQCCGTMQHQLMINTQGGTHLCFPGYRCRLWLLQEMKKTHDEVTMLHSIMTVRGCTGRH